MKNVLLILDNKLEFEFARTILSKLGFHVLSLQGDVDIHLKLQEHFPDLVITSVVGKQDKTLQEFMTIRDKRGTPKFIWVGPDLKMKQLSHVQLRVIDATLQRPLQPELLIRSVCELLELPAETHIKSYRQISNDPIYVGGKVKSATEVKTVRSEKYDQYLQNVEKKDQVFSLKELARRSDPLAGVENSAELSAQKKDFIKKLFSAKIK